MKKLILNQIIEGLTINLIRQFMILPKIELVKKATSSQKAMTLSERKKP